MSKTKCCNLTFIGGNHSPYATCEHSGVLYCRHCQSEPYTEIQTQRALILKLYQTSKETTPANAMAKMAVVYSELKGFYGE